MAILFRIDFHEDWAVGGEKKKLLVPGKDNPELEDIQEAVTGLYEE